MSIEVNVEQPSGSEPQPPKKPLTLLRLALPALSSLVEARKAGVAVSAQDVLGALGIDALSNAGLAFALTPDLQLINPQQDPLAGIGLGLKVAGVILAPQIIARHLQSRYAGSPEPRKRPVKNEGYFKGK